MIRLTRARNEVIPKGLRGNGRIKKNSTLIEQYRAGGNFEFKAAYWKAGKPQLRVEASSKCAYCEGPTALVAHGDVEHFRPKSKYWWLAYCYDNHLYACQICNETYKGDAFPVFGKRMKPLGSFRTAEVKVAAASCGPDPLDDSTGMTRSEFYRNAALEKSGLVDPYSTDPEPFFKWQADNVEKEVVVRAASPSQTVKRAFSSCEKLYGLNREELRKWRFRTYEKLEVFVDSLRALKGTPRGKRIQTQIRKMASAESEFSGMVRYFVRLWKVKLD